MSEHMTRAYIGIGSNIDPGANIVRALELLAAQSAIDALSNFYESPALGRPSHPAFINGVCRIETTHSARALKFDVLRDIEERLGRVRGGDAYAPRTIDLDVILYGEDAIDEEDLQLPDPDIATRPFLAMPLLELDPDIVLPDTGRPLRSICSTIPQGTLKLLPRFSEELKARFVK